MKHVPFRSPWLLILAVASCYKSSVRFDATTAPVLLGTRDAIAELGSPAGTHQSVGVLGEHIGEGSYAYTTAGPHQRTVFAYWRRPTNVLDETAMAHLAGRPRGAIRNLQVSATVGVLPMGGRTKMNVTGEVIEIHGPVALDPPRPSRLAFHAPTPADADAWVEQRIAQAPPTDPADRWRWVLALGLGPGVSWSNSSGELFMQLWGGWSRRNITLGFGMVAATFTGPAAGRADDIRSEQIMVLGRWYWLRGAFFAAGVGPAISNHVERPPGEKYSEGWGFYTATGYELRIASWFALAAEAAFARSDTPYFTGATWGGMLTSLFYIGGGG
jgi:hypothetical protein